MTPSPEGVRALGGAVAAIAAVGAFYGLLPVLVRPFWRLALLARYRIIVTGREHVPSTGPALLVMNHVTWIDGFFLLVVSPRFLFQLTNADYVDLPILRAFARRAGIIPIPSRGPRALRTAIAEARGSLDRGQVVGIYPEAQLTRTGRLGPFHRGLEVILQGRDEIPVIPVALENLWGSALSFSDGRPSREGMKGFRHTVVIQFGPPVAPPVTAFAVRQAVLVEKVRACEHLLGPSLPPVVDLALPHLVHPELGLLSASSPDYDRGGIKQVGHRPGTVGQSAPGVALRVVDAAGLPLPPDSEGRLQALFPGHDGWIETGIEASLDRDGFVQVVDRSIAVSE